MIDQATGQAGVGILATAIAETFEGHANRAARFNAATDPAVVEIRLQTAAEDTLALALASALRVLTRFSDQR